MSQPDGPGLGTPAAPPAACMAALSLTLSHARDELVDALARSGFRRIDDRGGATQTWRGCLTFQPVGEGSTHTTVIEIAVPEQFPFVEPRVLPCSQATAERVTGRAFSDYYEPGRGWHRDQDMAMCLFIAADRTRLPWTDGEALLEQATAWLSCDAAGWPTDEPALDLDRYLPPSTETRPVLYGPLEGCDQRVLRLSPKANGILRVKQSAAPQRHGTGTRSRRRWRGDAVMVLDAGQLVRPIRGWDDLVAAGGAERAERLTRAQQDGLRWVLLTYRRGDVAGVLGLELVAEREGAVALRAMTAVPDDLATRRVRAHPDAGALAGKQVAIVGVGAIGSVVADVLHRSGVGSLHLRDPDIVLPGNTMRHLLGEADIGRPKARAVAYSLHAARPWFDRPSFTQDRVTTLNEAVEMLAGFDLVVDATADSTATALLTAAARAGAGQLLSVCVLADGYAVRVDRTPTRPGDEPLEPLPLPASTAPVYETGCGSPVSTTPPGAVWEAAAVAARHGIALLLDPDGVPAGETRVLRGWPQPS